MINSTLSINNLKIISLITLGLCLIDLSLQAQHTETFNISKYFKWSQIEIKNNQNISEMDFVFEGNLQRDDETNLPVYVHEIPLSSWNPAKDSVELTTTNEEYIFTTIPENQFLNRLNIACKPLLKYIIVYSNKKPILKTFIFPFILSPDKNYYKKLQSININVVVHSHTITELKSAKLNYPDNSLLSSGKWIKIKISKSGVYKIPYSKLSDWGISNPSNAKIYGFGGTMLPKRNSDVELDDMEEIAITKENNAVYFYAQGPVEWKFDNAKNMFMHQLNDYTDEAYYFVTETGNDKIIENVNKNTLTPNTYANTYDDYSYHEIEKLNVIKSGRTWYGERFDKDINSERIFEFDFPDMDNNSNIHISTTAISRSSNSTTLRVYVNGNTTPLQTLSFTSVDIGKPINDFAISKSATSNFNPVSNNIKVRLKYGTDLSTSVGYLDKIDIQARRHLKYSGEQFNFRDLQSVELNNVTQFSINNTGNSGLKIWDVSDIKNPKNINYTTDNSSVKFIYQTDDLKEFVIFSYNETLPTPEFVEEVTNQNLHGLSNIDYIIVTASKFIEQAKRLARLHQTYSNLSTAVVTQEQIFNEFSSGQPDVVAIRMFAKMLYDKAGANESAMPKYMLLFGDGSYDNKSKDGNSNYILTYQSVESIYYTRSYTTDDFYGFLDDYEGDNEKSDIMDIGIGRFPVRTTDEATIAVDKVEKYLTGQTKSPWKTKITFIGDDEDNNTHMSDANTVAKKVAQLNPEFEIQKIYLDAYPKVIQANGARYPDVEYAIDKAINDGILIFNYSGHGGEKGLAAEQIVTIEKIKSWTNIDKLALFITATCEFSRYDDKDFTSAGEEVFLSPIGGGIALFTTTRLVYSSWNREINSNFFSFAFQRDENGNKPRLGDILKETKRITSDQINKLNFTLLGDPALQLCYPDNYIVPVKINNQTVSGEDTLKALSVATIESQIVSAHNEWQTSFQGSSSTSLYDKKVEIETLANTGDNPFKFETYENILFKGQATVTNGEFVNTFIIPKDIKYNYGNGRIFSYANSDGQEAFGAYNLITIGGSVTGTDDNMGPEIEVYLNNDSFRDGGTVGQTPLLIAKLYDENGINTSGNGIGHDISLSIDNSSAKYILNNYFEADLNSYQSGQIIYQIPKMEPGKHTLSLKAWDTYNNSSEVTINFRVSDSNDLKIGKVSVFPNPYKSAESQMTVYIEHDDPNSVYKSTINLYSLSGRLIASKTLQDISVGPTSIIQFNPTFSNGGRLTRGIYLLQVQIDTSSGKSGTISQKIVVIE